MNGTDKENIYGADDKIVNIGDAYNEEKLTDEQLKTYIDVCGMETPNLWGRIEKGYDAEIRAAKRRRIRRYAGAAAVLLVLAIAVPVAYIGTKNDGNDSANSMDTVYEESVVEDGDVESTAEAFEADMGSASESENYAESEDYAESADEEYEGDSAYYDAETAEETETKDTTSDSVEITVTITVSGELSYEGTSAYVILSDTAETYDGSLIMEKGARLYFYNQEDFAAAYAEAQSNGAGEYQIIIYDAAEVAICGEEDAYTAEYACEFKEFKNRAALQK